jgi:PAS domain S-box-containing protein
MKDSQHLSTDLLRQNELYTYHLLDTGPEPELDDIVALAAKLCTVPYALISFNDGNRHWFKACFGFQAQEITLENSISSKAIEQPNEIFEIYDLQADERFKDHPMLQQEESARFCASIPLISNNGFAIGNLILIDKIPRTLDDHEKDIIRILAKQIMHFLNLRRKRLIIEATQKDLEAKNLQLKETFRQLDDYKTALDSAAIVSITDLDGTITYVNDTFCKISGYSKDELIGQNQRIVHSNFHTPDFWKKMWQTIGSGAIWSDEIRNKTKSGELYWVETTIVPFLDEQTKKPVKFLSIRKDITEQKNIQQAEMQSLLFAQEIDRDNFAEDLHEGLAQRLVAIRLSAQMLEARLNGNVAPEIISTLDLISDQLKTAIDETKNMAIELMPRSMMNDGIVSSLNNYLARIESKYNVNCVYVNNFTRKTHGTKNVEITIYRVIVSIIEKAILSKVINSIELILNDSPNIHSIIRIHSIPLLEKNYAKPLSSYLGFIGQLSRRVELSGGQLSIEDSLDNTMTEIRMNFE